MYMFSNHQRDYCCEYTILAFPTCAPGEFTCPNSRCIDEADTCNGRNDCRDPEVTDELGCGM